ncbi:hypothetical protein PM082_002154 [Marasmius tenuissimus]|nr:hypothetical protein PM082_002154 [Marasmius tenuissimus]
MTQDPWLDVAKKLAISASKAAPVPGLEPAVEALCGFITLCEGVIANRHATRQLCVQCHDLVEAVKNYQPKPPSTLQEAFDNVMKTVEGVKNRAATWSGLSWGRAFIRQKQIQEGIAQCKDEISDCFMRFQLAAGADTNRWQEEFFAITRTDHEELVAFLCEIQNGQVIVEEVMREYGEKIIQGQEGISNQIKEVMRIMQQPLAELTKGSSRNEDQVAGLSQNLYRLQITTKVLLPEPNLVSGEITGIESRAIAGTTTVDVFRGQYLRGQTVAIKVVRAVDGDEKTLSRFLREVRVWERIWSIDKGIHILPFYGFSQADEGRPYMVSPWQENGTALAYVKKHDTQVDYRKLIRDIAHGIHVLHCLMDPPVVHGDIQAANILINAEGNPLLADFGLSKMVEDMTGTPFTQSNGVANVYRWFAPEIYTEQGKVSLASDVYSFAMTILELMTHAHPFSQYKHPPQVVVMVSNGRNPDRPTEGKVVRRGLDDELWRLMTECWNRMPSARPGIKEILTRL